MNFLVTDEGEWMFRRSRVVAGNNLVTAVYDQMNHSVAESINQSRGERHVILSIKMT